ncbi:plasmid pRiA4b ORF-3 family protein [Aeromicrobium sp. PE09-221]|uniref:plasmid pRiA4b ORF-3 family protein n=1 Tax=Aeromicrobium sp. PE09-221 TaxID=1898043 RepID=UPI00191C89E7|nr:plasmid pRiA4b ORF-3 family protein [Aeromicrobium sp. PE09-221]
MPTDETQDAVLRLVSSMSPAEQRELLDSLLGRDPIDMFFELSQPKPPTLLRKPHKVRGFQVRIDLLGVKPPIWRRLILPGDLTLDCVHAVLNEAMGWTNSHLHRFRTGNDPYSPHFITEFDLSEGDEGVLEDDVRLDQVVAAKGVRLWYDYDFGDGWEHVVKVEAVLPEPPEDIELVTGRRACPPEDVGGPWGYDGVARWVESGYDKTLLPEQFENAQHAKEWLPLGWHPAVFDLEAARISLRDALEPVDG